MLQQFTWGQFLLASFLLSFLWYVMVLVSFYRAELGRLFSGGVDRGSGEALSHRWEKGVEVLDEKSEVAERASVSEGVMGKSALPAGMEVMGMGKLAFAGSSDGRYEQVGMVADVIQELKLIFAQLEASARDKRDFFRLLEKVKEEYGRIGAHPSIGSINAYVATHVPFLLSAEELENLWD